MNDDQPEKRSEILIYQTEDGRIRIDVRLDDETVWLNQKLMAELFQKDVRTINEHIKNIYSEGELDHEATIRKFRIVQTDFLWLCRTRYTGRPMDTRQRKLWPQSGRNAAEYGPDFLDRGQTLQGGCRDCQELSEP